MSTLRRNGMKTATSTNKTIPSPLFRLCTLCSIISSTNNHNVGGLGRECRVKVSDKTIQLKLNKLCDKFAAHPWSWWLRERNALNGMKRMINLPHFVAQRYFITPWFFFKLLINLRKQKLLSLKAYKKNKINQILNKQTKLISRCAKQTSEKIQRFPMKTSWF